MKKKILYVSSLCSEKVLNYLFESSKNKPEQAVQKFHRLLTTGLALHKNKCSVEVLSSLPIVPSNHDKKIWNLKKEESDNITFTYIPLLNIKFIKNIGVFFYTFFKIIFWSISNRNEDKVIICDVLNVSIASASLLASKFSSVKIVTIVTDLPGLMITNIKKKNSILKSLYTKIASYVLHKFDGYILLTVQMNEIVNPYNKPYMIMEGLVDINMKGAVNNLENKNEVKTVIYAGGLYKKYGVGNLINAFQKISNPNIKLYLYGSGEMVPEIQNITKSDYRIIYKGMVPNNEVVKEQLRSTLLINPRPSTEEFTKYSFPSKNMEYMVSGTPMITTKLKGMPDEYLEYVYVFEDESVEGMNKTLLQILSKDKDELHNYGLKAKNFVLNKKNNIIQSDRILDFIEKI
ncbi:glycosyltransferase [Cellulophaga sp. E16_2]|uniref:glycosyltransferase n=1 Tax=Cellulophaga sp. E16_2 TaxID=2789297 RepID=UPI001A928C97|nr:glycosyltransferase [Cellulophaga sp. E16_2]MBO0592814.1 glycosyltransferase [Cellulophaga sp. E16_2]